MVFLIRKLHTIILYLIKLLRQALCCFKSRSKNSNLQEETEELTQIGVIPNRKASNEWSNSWGDLEESRKPTTVSDHIAQYREKKMHPNAQDEGEIALQSIFQELEPTNIKQKKVLIGSDINQSSKSYESIRDMSRLSADSVTNNLGEWIEEATSGWDEQTVDPTEIIRQQKRLIRINSRPSRLADKITA